MEEEKLVLCEKKGYIGYIIINRPDKMNGINRATYAALADACDYFEEQDDIKVVVIKGAGRCFSAGFDLSTTVGKETNETQRRAYEKYGNRTRKKIWEMTKPTIAQVHSYCYGGAHDIALACDFCIVSDDASMGVNEIQFGQGATFLAMPYMMNLRKCREYLLTGKFYDGKTAVEIGIANQCVVCDPENKYDAKTQPELKHQELDEAVKAFAKQLAMVPRNAMALQKKSINRCIDAMGFAMMREEWLDTLCLGMCWENEEVNEFNAKLKELGSLKKAKQWREEKYSNI